MRINLDHLLSRIIEYAIYVFIFCYSFSKALVEISTTVAIIAWILLRVRGKSWPEFLRQDTFILLGLFTLFSALSFFVSMFPEESLHGIGKLLQEITFCLVIWDTAQHKKNIRWIVWLGIAFLVVIFVDCFVQGVAHKDFLRGKPLSYVGPHPRLTGPFGVHSLFGNYLITWSSFLIAIFLSEWKLKMFFRVALAGMIGLSLVALFHTQSRGIWLAFTVAVTFFGIVKAHRGLLTALFTAVILGLLFLPKNMIIHEDAEGKEQSLVERGVLWKRAVDVISARPLLGTGINTFVKAYQEYDQDKSWRVQNYYAHNSYLQLASDRGLPALFFLAAFLAVFFRRGFQALRKCADPEFCAYLRGVLTALAGFLVFALYDTAFEPLQTGLLFWTLLGLGMAMISMQQNERKEVSL